MSASAHDAAIAQAYDRRAAEYIALLGAIEQLDPRDRATISRWGNETTGVLVDAGSGPGLWTRLLHDAGRDVVGIDLSAAFIATARDRHPHVSFLQGSFLALPQSDSSCGGVLSWYSLIHTPPALVPSALAEFARVLEPGGTLLLGYFDGEPGEPFDHAVATAYFWSAEALAPLLADAGLVVEWSETRGREPGEASARPHGALVARRV